MNPLKNCGIKKKVFVCVLKISVFQTFFFEFPERLFTNHTQPRNKKSHVWWETITATSNVQFLQYDRTHANKNYRYGAILLHASNIPLQKLVEISSERKFTKTSMNKKKLVLYFTGTYREEFIKADREYNLPINKVLRTVKTGMTFTSREIWSCDPNVHKEGESPSLLNGRSLRMDGNKFPVSQV